MTSPCSIRRSGESPYTGVGSPRGLGRGGRPVGVLAAGTTGRRGVASARPPRRAPEAAEGHVHSIRQVGADRWEVNSRLATPLCVAARPCPFLVLMSTCNTPLPSSRKGRFWGWTEESADCQEPPCVEPLNTSADGFGFLALNPAGRLVIPSFYMPPVSSFTIEFWFAPACTSVCVRPSPRLPALSPRAPAFGCSPRRCPPPAAPLHCSHASRPTDIHQPTSTRAPT